MRGVRLKPAHEHIEQSLARRLLRHVAVAAAQHLAVDLLHMRGQDRERGAELAAQIGERYLGTPRNFSKIDALDRLLGQQGHEGRDDALARRAEGSLSFIHHDATSTGSFIYVELQVGRQKGRQGGSRPAEGAGTSNRRH